MSDQLFTSGDLVHQTKSANLVAFLRTPEGLEMLADAVRATRRLLADQVDRATLQELLEFENECFTASARPLPPSLVQ